MSEDETLEGQNQEEPLGDTAESVDMHVIGFDENVKRKSMKLVTEETQQV